MLMNNPSSSTDHQLGANHSPHQALVSSAGVLLIRTTESFPMAALTNHHKLSGFNSTNLCAYSPRRQSLKTCHWAQTKMSAGCAPSRGSGEEPISLVVSASGFPRFRLEPVCPSSKPVVQHLQTSLRFHHHITFSLLCPISLCPLLRRTLLMACRANWLLHDNLLISKILKLIIFTKCLFTKWI